MRKSFTRLLSLVMFLTLFCSYAMAIAAPTNVRPIDGTTKAYTKTTDKIMVIYPEAVKANSGSIRVTKAVGGALVAVLPATDSRISYAKGDTVVVDLSASLSELTEYSVSIDATTFKTVKDGTAKGGESWNFTTGDYTAPTLKSVKPVKDAALANSSIDLEMTFDDASALQLGSGKVTLYKADGNVWELINVTSGLAGNVLTLHVNRLLEDNVNYAVTIDGGVITDDGKRADGKKNAYAGLTDRSVWKFSSKDFTAPGYATDYPKKGAITNTSAAVLVKTTEAGKAYAVISTSATAPSATDIVNDGAKKTVTVVAGTEYSINFTGLSEATQYYIYVVTQNNDGVVSSTVTSVNPVTSETQAPVLSAVVYKKGGDQKAAGAVAANVVTTVSGAATVTGGWAVPQDVDNIVLDFNEEVKIGAGNVIIYKAIDNSVFATVAASSLSVNNDDKSLVKVPVSGMQNNTKYYVTIPNTIVLDKYDNKYSGISAITAWAFTSNDVVAPSFTYTPVEGSANVKIDANIVLTFNELIYPKAPFTTADAFVVKVNGNPVAFANGVSTNDGKFTTYTIDPAADFASSAVVTVEIKPNSLTDIGGNVVDPQGQGINFVVADKAAPVLTSWSSVTKPWENVVIKFNEAIYFAGGGDITNANLYTILTVKENDSNGANVAYNATISDNKKEITIVPANPWGSEKTYYVSISSALQDANGNTYVGASPSQVYTIADATSASVDLSSVDGKTISTTSAVTLIFKEGNAIEPRASLYYAGGWNAYAVADMAKVIVLKEGSANGPDVAFTVTTGDDATFAIAAALQGNKTYYLGVGASTKGVDGNVNGEKFVTFNTKFEGTPSVVSLSPSDNAVQVDKGSNFVITFDTDVEKAGGAIAAGTITYNDGNGAVNVADGEVSINGKVVTINLNSDLSNDKNYDIVVAAGVFKNKNSAATNNAINVDAWDFATKDTKLDVQTLTPDFATNIAIDAKLKLTFNEKVVKGQGYIDIKKTGTDVTVERIDVVSSQVALSDGDKTVTITPSATLSYNTQYYVEVSGGALKDGVGNQLASIYGKIDAATLTSWTFTTANPALAIVKVSPADGSDKVAADASIVVEFNREIAPVSGEVGYIEWKNGVAQIQSYPFGSSNVSISGKTLTITHPNKLFPGGSEIFVYLPQGVIKAATDGAIKNDLVDRTTSDLSFFTGDVNAPKPSFTPEQFVSWNAVYTPVDANITITFDEDIYNIDGTTIDNGDVTSGGLFTISGVGSFVGTISGRTVTLDPTSNLNEFTDYTITVVANKIKDVNGKTITSNITSTFRTVDKTAPTVAFTLSGADKKVVLSNVTLTDANNNKFYYLLRVKSSDAAPTADEIKAANNKDASSGTVNGFEIGSLVPSTTYQLYYVSDDKFGNTSSVAVKEASTDDTVAPTLVSTDPANEAADVNVTVAGNVEVKLTFNEKVQAGAGAITVRDFATQAILYSLNQTNLSTVSGDDKSLKLTIPGVPAAGSPVKMYVEVAAGTIKDMANNAYAGAFGKNVISFTTEDNQAPTVNAGASTNGTVNLDANIKVVFSENVKAGNGNLVLYKNSVSVANAIQVFSAAEATFSGNSATVNPTADLVHGVTYIVSVETGFAKDMSSNSNGNVASAAVTFTGSTNFRPSVTSVSPSGGTTAIVKSALASIVVDFSEDIYLTVAGYSKPLALMTQAELLARFSMKDGNGNTIAIDQIVKNTAQRVTVLSAASRYNDETSYTLTINGFEDDKGLVMDNKVVSYVTSDGTAPVITFSPAYKNSNVNPATSLTLTFSENIYDEVIDANKKIFSYVDNLNVKNFVFLKEGSVTGADVAFTATIEGKVITIVPSASLKSGVTYYYGMTRPVEDINMTAIPVPTEEKTFVYFTAADYTIPEMEALNATNFAPLGTGVAANAGMSVIFKEEVKVSTGSIVIRREDGTIFQTVSGADLSIDSNNNKKLKIAHNNFEPYTNYFVEIGASVVVDKAGNANAKFNDPTPEKGWLFTTNDTYDLTATVSPNGDNTPRSVNLEMTFNKAPLAQAGKFVAVYKADGTAVYQVAATSLVISGKTAMFPNVALAANQAYYARVEAGAFKDASGNTYAGIMDNSWVFSTVDNIAPKLVASAALSPVNNAGSVSQTATFTMTFDRPVVLGTGVITVRDKVSGDVISQVDVANATIDGSVLKFTFPDVLAKNHAYYILVPAGAVTNTEITKDKFAGIVNTYDWAFTTGSDEVAPTFVSGTPSGATNLKPVEVSLVGTFSEGMVAGLGNVVIYDAADNTEVESIAVVASMVSGTKLTVAPTKLKVNKSYYVLVDAGALKDYVGNAFAGLTDKAIWKFSTGDYTGPTVVVTDPVAPISTIFNVGLKFNEPVSGVFGGVTIAGGKIEEITGTGAEYVISVSAKEQTEVTLVLTNAIKDMSVNSNKFAGDTLVYKTGDFTAPALVSATPTMDVKLTDNHPTFKMTFNENVKLGAGGSLKVYKVMTTTAVLDIPITAAMINGKEVTVTYTTLKGLDKSTNYFVKVDGSALTDAAGNKFVGVTDAAAWTFKTGDKFVTGINPTLSLEFKVYPNPFVDFVNVANASQLSKVVITNIAGQVVKEVVNPTEQIQLNELRSGVYFISLYDMDNVIAKTAKIVKR